MRKPKSSPLLTRESVLAFINDSPTPVGKNEIARAFNVHGSDKLALKDLLRTLEAEGLLSRGKGRRVAPPAAMPEVVVVEVTHVDHDGYAKASPVGWTGEGPAPVMRVNAGSQRGGAPLAVGERLLGRSIREKNGRYTFSIVRRLGRFASSRVLGLYTPSRQGGPARLLPVNRRHRDEFLVSDDGGAEAGELVLAELLPSTRYGQKTVKVVERLGSVHDPRAISLMAIYGNDIPTAFSPAAQEQARGAQPVTLGKRTDLRDIPLVTIDGSDARDFDDAVFAEPDTDAANAGGWHLIVAIADVAHYVTPASPLDKAAFDRGNSAYFPDRVVPMLPEELSNELCSLKPHVDRACMAAHLWIDKDGNLKRHQFVRGLMKSMARLTYDQVQAAIDGTPDDTTGPLLDPVIKPLYAAYAILSKARQKRGTLDLDLPERLVKLDSEGRIAEIGVRERHDSHRLIEEFMITANVAAAESLEARGMPCMYRIHDKPSEAKLESLRKFMSTLGYNLPKGDDLRPANFTHLLQLVEGKPEALLVNQVVLRSQAQAVYSPENIGHFGLALRHYAHFTSPIRRYADLVVHRALIRGYGLGEGGLSDEEASRMAEIGEHISLTERRAAAAERETIDRFVAAYLADKVGGSFAGRISGVTQFGLFVTLTETGADGLIPISTLPQDFYEVDETQQCLVGRRYGRIYRLSAPVQVILRESDPVMGSMVFALDGDESADPLAGRKGPDGKPIVQPMPLTGKKSIKKNFRRPPKRKGS